MYQNACSSTLCTFVSLLHSIISLRLLAIRMALVLRRSTHVGLDIHGYTVAQWRRRKERKRGHRDIASWSGRPEVSAHDQPVSIECPQGLVHYTAATTSSSEGGVASEQDGHPAAVGKGPGGVARAAIGHPAAAIEHGGHVGITVEVITH